LDERTDRRTDMKKLIVAFFAVYRTLLKVSVAILTMLICFHDAFTVNFVSHCHPRSTGRYNRILFHWLVSWHRRWTNCLESGDFLSHRHQVGDGRMEYGINRVRYPIIDWILDKKDKIVIWGAKLISYSKRAKYRNHPWMENLCFPLPCIGTARYPHLPLCREGNEKLSNKNKLNHLQEKSFKNFAALLKAEGNFAESRK